MSSASSSKSKLLSSTVLIFWSLLFFIFALEVEAQTQVEDYYEEGIQLYESGEIGPALQLWIDAFNSIEDSSQIDPRIGSAFIEIVVKNQLQDLYQASSVIYYWALSSKGTGDLRDFLKTEILKSEAIFDEFEFNRLKRDMETNPYEVAFEVLQKWVSMDPTPESRTNERLIEHWERIIYSKNLFNKANNTVFGTDDRALTYIKYGNPEIIRKGRLDYNSGIIYSSVATVLNPTDKEVKKLMENILANYYAAEYEVWVYPFLSPDGRFVKVFGEKYTTRSFQEIDVITDFIPEYAFNRLRGVSTPGGTYTPGFFLLYNYLHQFGAYDSYFSDQYSELNEILALPSNQVNSRRIYTDGSWVFPRVRTAAADMNRIFAGAPVSKSVYLDSLDNVEVKVKEYQYFNENGTPKTLFVMNSYPMALMLDYMAKQKRVDLSDYGLKHSVFLTEDNGQNPGKLIQEPSVPALSKGMVHPAQTIFEISGEERRYTQFVFSVQVFDKLESNKPGDNLLPKSLKAVGRNNDIIPAERKRIEKFDISEIMIGYQIDETNYEDEVPFIVAIDNKIPSFSNLFIHFQVINMEKNSEEKVDLRVELNVKKKRSGLGIFRRDKINSISVSYDDNLTQIRESLEFELVDRDADSYELTLEFLDINSGNRITRKIDFELVNTE